MCDMLWVAYSCIRRTVVPNRVVRFHIISISVVAVLLFLSWDVAATTKVVTKQDAVSFLSHCEKSNGLFGSWGVSWGGTHWTVDAIEAASALGKPFGDTRSRLELALKRDCL